MHNIRWKEIAHIMKEERISQKKISAYWLGLGIYTAFLLLLGGCFLSYTDRSLIRYENAQPENVMKNYLEAFQKTAADGTLYGTMDMPEASNAFEGAEVYQNLYRTRLNGIGSYTFVKDASGYLAENPAYYIYGDGEPVARVTFSASNAYTILGILTVMDWTTETVTPILNSAPRDYFIRIPDDYKATVNGVELSAEHQTETGIENPDFVNVSAYVKMPVLAEYRVSGLLAEPEIKVFDADGKEKEAIADAEGNIAIPGGERSPMPKERYDDALKMAQVWENFLTRDLDGESHGLGNIQKYLIKDSYYWNMAKKYAGSIDITFISGHDMANPPYSNIEISDYVSYGENCYSCHIYFEKNMILRNGNRSVDTIDSTFYFVKYDDSDNGKDDPHWAIADMIAATGEKKN